MVYGYARVSTKGQARDGNSLESQQNELMAAGSEKIYSDAFTGTKAHRPELDKLMEELVSGDKLIVTKLDRIARSATQGFEMVQQLLSNGISIHVLNMGLMDNIPTGRLILHIMLAFAEFERDMIVERTQEGKAIAKTKDDYREGRPKKYSRQQIELALKLLADHSYKEACLAYNVNFFCSRQWILIYFAIQIYGIF
ncbi:Putative DNA-invertase from lambdoid prophage Rac [Clostridium sp. C105KSO15]|nr:Putative DNA-invertase from lambdoid prophage Rac [Clostridium sp. C105KSO15]